MSKLSPNPAISQIPQPVADINALTHVVQSLKQALDSLAGFRGPVSGRAVTFDDLVSYGIVVQASLNATDPQSLLANEIARATAAETKIGAELKAETSRATTAETSLGGRITTEAAARAAADHAETTARVAAVSNEALLRATSVDALTANLLAETTRATAAEALKLNKAGTTTNDNAPAGRIGEYISSNRAIGSAISLTTSTAADVTTIALTAGDWDVSGSVGYTISASAVIVQSWITTVAATPPTAPNAGGYNIINATVGTGCLLPTGTTRLSLAAPTTVYLGSFSTFSSGTVAAYGFIGARRAR